MIKEMRDNHPINNRNSHSVMVTLLFHRKCITVAILFFCCSSLFSNQNIDSLQTGFRQLPNDTHSINIIIDEAVQYINVDVVVFLDLIKIAEEKAVLIKNAKSLGTVFYLKGVGLLRMSDFSQASWYLSMAKIIAEKTNNDKLFIVSIAELGQLEDLNGNIDQAIQYYSEGLIKAERQDNPVFKGMLLSKISGLYYKKQQFQQSISYSKESYNLIKETGDITNIVTELNNLVMLFSTIGETDSAEHYLNENKKFIEIFGYSDPGQIHMYYNNWGNVLMAKHKYNEALNYYFKGEKSARDFAASGSIYNTFLYISQAYEKLGSYKNALKYYKTSFNMMDSLTSQENFLRGVEIQNKLESQKQENELFRITRENEIKQAEITIIQKRKNVLVRYLILLASIILLSIFLIILLVYRAKSRKRTYKIFQDKNARIEQQSKELSQNAKLIAKFQFQMNPRFVFNALHNIQGLVIGKENESANIQLQRLAELMRKTYNNAEKEYIPLGEEVIYLKTYFRFEAKTINQDIKFNVIVSDNLDDALIPPMMIQPFIENSIKHAQLEMIKDPQITVIIDAEQEFLKVTIEDNGKGIQYKKEKTEASIHSITAIQSRIERIFTSVHFPANKEFFSIKTVPELSNGTRITFYLPLQYLY